MVVQLYTIKIIIFTDLIDNLLAKRIDNITTKTLDTIHA